MNINLCKRTWDSPVREPWNRRIYFVLKSIDHHNELYFTTGDKWHLEQANYLRTYIVQLKDWIKKEEENI